MSKLNDPEIAAAFDADISSLQFTPDFPPEIRDTINTIATRQRETTEAIDELRSALMNSRQAPITSVADARTQKWYQNPWIWSIILTCAVILIQIYGLKTLNDRAETNATKLAAIEQIIASDDFANYLAQNKDRREDYEKTLKSFGLKPLPAQPVHTQPIDRDYSFFEVLSNLYNTIKPLLKGLLIVFGVMFVIAILSSIGASDNTSKPNGNSSSAIR